MFGGDFTHVLLLDGDMQHLPEEAASLLDEAASGAPTSCIGERRFERCADAGVALPRQPDRQPRVVVVRRRCRCSDTQCGFRVFRVDALRPLQLRATGYEVETEMLVKVRRRGGRIATVPITAVYAGQRSKLRPVRDTTRTCFLAVYYRFLERV